jgi:hypothetical protein
MLLDEMLIPAVPEFPTLPLLLHLSSFTFGVSCFCRPQQPSTHLANAHARAHHAVLGVLLPPLLLTPQHPPQWLQPVGEMMVQVAAVAAASVEAQQQTFKKQPAVLTSWLAVECTSRYAVITERRHPRALKRTHKQLQRMLCKPPSLRSTCRPHAETW